jgi:hypothetical protein
MRVWRELSRRDGLRHAIPYVDVALAGAIFAAVLLVGCGGDFGRPRSESPGREGDSGTPDRCVQQAWTMAFGFSIDASDVISHAGIDFLPANRAQLTQTVSTVAQGAPGSQGLLSAALISANGDPLARVLFEDPRLVGSYGRSQFGGSYGEVFIRLVPGALRLVITNWATGAVLLDLDFRGDRQLLCLNQPCLDLCEKTDGGVSPSLDASADVPEVVDQGGRQ